MGARIYTIATLWANCRDKLTLLAIPPAFPSQPTSDSPSTSGCFAMLLVEAPLSSPRNPSPQWLPWLLVPLFCFARTLSNFVVAFVSGLVHSLTAPNAISPCAQAHYKVIQYLGGGRRGPKGTWALSAACGPIIG